jgi:hypothetical protein
MRSKAFASFHVDELRVMPDATSAHKSLVCDCCLVTQYSRTFDRTRLANWNLQFRARHAELDSPAATMIADMDITYFKSCRGNSRRCSNSLNCVMDEKALC